MQAQDVRSRRDLAVCVRSLNEVMGSDPDGYENVTLDRFLDAFAAWLDDMDGYFANLKQPVPEQPDWRLVAAMMAAAAIYE